MPYEREIIPEDELLDTEYSPEFGYEELADTPEVETPDAEETDEVQEGRERIFEGHGYRLEDGLIRDEKGDVWTNGDPTLAGALDGLKTEGGGMLFVDTVAKEIDGGTEFFHTYYAVDAEGNVSFFIDREVIGRPEADEIQPMLAEEQESPSWQEILPGYAEPQPQPEAMAEEVSADQTMREDIRLPEQSAADASMPEERRAVQPDSEVQFAPEIAEPEMTDTETRPITERLSEFAVENVTLPSEKADTPEMMQETDALVAGIQEPQAQASAPDVWLTRLLDSEPLPIGTEDVVGDPKPETSEKADTSRISEKTAERRDHRQEHQHTIEERESSPVSESLPLSESAAHTERTPGIARAESPIRIVREELRAAESAIVKETKERPAPVAAVRDARRERDEKPGSSERSERRDRTPKERFFTPGARTERMPDRVAKREVPAELSHPGARERAIIAPRSVENTRRRSSAFNADEDSQTEHASRLRLKRDGIMMEIAA